MTEIEIVELRREDRLKQTAEVFTPNLLVHQMLSKLPKEVWKKGKTFCDPACGNGNFLIHVLIRKLQRGHKPFDALQTIYGVDIMRDNIRECRDRLLKLISIFEEITADHIKVVFRNIVFLNQKKYPKGALQYDFSFRTRFSEINVQRWLEEIQNGRLAAVKLPVDEAEFGQQKFIFE
jgi:hypothetical protein